MLKCWIVGFVFSLVVLASDISGPHTDFGMVAILFGLPLFLPTTMITRDHAGNHYALMLLSGSLFYGLVAYLIVFVVQLLHSRKSGTTI